MLTLLKIFQSMKDYLNNIWLAVIKPLKKDNLLVDEKKIDSKRSSRYSGNNNQTRQAHQKHKKTKYPAAVKSPAGKKSFSLVPLKKYS